MLQFRFTGTEQCRTQVKERESEGIRYYDFSFDYESEQIPAPVTVAFYTAYIDTASVWTPMSGGFGIAPNWAPTRCESRLAGSMPLLALIAPNGENRVTAALSEVKSDVCFTVGVVEENCTAEWKIELFRTPSAPCKSYSFTLRFDERKRHFSECVKSVAQWWEGAFPPCRVPEAAYEPLYSTWYNFHQKITPQAMLGELKLAKELGFATVIVDDGWQCMDNNRGYAFTGDWKPQPQKIGTGKDFADACREIGINSMFWYSVPFVGECSENYGRFKDMALRVDYDLTGREVLVLDPRYREVREFLIGLYRDAMEQYGLDGLKLDFIDCFRFQKGNPPPAEGMDIPVLEDAVHRLMREVYAAVTAVKADALIEFRQTYVGPVVRTFGNMLRVGDCPYSANSNIRGVAELRLTSGNTAVHTDMMMWHPETPAEDAAYQLLSGLYAVPQISVLLKSLPQTHLQVLKRFLAYKKENDAVLLKGEFFSDLPFACERMSARTKEKQIVCLYRGNAFAAEHPVTDVFFGVGGEKLLDLSALKKEVSLKIYDCFGNRVFEASASGLTKVTVPPCGLAEIRE